MSDLNEALSMTGLETIEELIDMAKVGTSLMDAIATYVKAPSLIEGWSPADDPAEIVGDLYNLFEESIACHKADLERLKAAQQSKAVEDVLVERRRQVEAEGWTPAHDDQHQDFSLAKAASVYAAAAAASRADRAVMDQFGLPGIPGKLQEIWPLSWDISWLKPTSRRRDLIKAAALIIAEIERLDRAEGAR
ncbi:hypothetical protein GOA89_14845 [Sinorhizobium meliloti]|nr:hypothetical protein [Sinorhizobium meliloti]MDW9847574.1 hypothetical protein [Sinorhizobium meliloti]MDX0144043.1 hypothetical protein [Sinorhizobium meliloti]MDX0150468.1 hypothetical protein [Sinorhizobium meliloti]MDX0169752.1 hypothetical protein [Sinorhizobium meliloti]